MENHNFILYTFLAIFAGIIVTIQGPINVELGKSLGSDLYSVLSSFLLGTIVVIIFLLIIREPVPSFELFIKTTPWKYLGAVTGAIYVISVVTIIPILGVGYATVLLMFSQLIAAMVIDHFGLFGYMVRPFDTSRLTGVILMALGIYLINRR